MDIKNRWSNAVIFSIELPEAIAALAYGARLGWTILQAVKARADLSYTNLSRADLSCADLSRADLSYTNLSCADISRADLSGANLSDADLASADLSRADLSCADLSRADLSGANLSDADLASADLASADLSGTNLSWSDLSDADLSRADLSGTNLSWSDLSDADLSRADLSGANLSCADLASADLSAARADFFLILLHAKAEVTALLSAITEGRVNGSVYTGRCSCLIGTIAQVRDIDPHAIDGELRPKSNRPAERLFLAIKEGDTPENNPVSAIVADWTREFIALT